MIFDVRSVEIKVLLEATPSGHNPVMIVKRSGPDNQVPKAGAGVFNADGATWHILQSKLPQQNAEDVDWTADVSGTHIAIPMLEYLITYKEVGYLAVFGAQFGLLVARMMATKFGSLERVLMVISEVFSRPDGKEGFAIYAGVALKEE